MKRLTIVLLCVALAFSLVACGGDKEPATNPGTSEQESTTTTASTESAEPTDSTTEADTTASSDATGTTGKTEASKTESTAATAPTTKKPTSASNTTQVANNEINWEAVFGADTTVASGSNGSTTTTTTTTTTTAATTTTTVPPTQVEEVLLPAVGTDVDVVKLKGRIRISDIKLEKNVLTVTIKNESKNWINQETDWVQFTCFDKDGKELKGEGEQFGRIYLGCLEYDKSVTSTITLPAGTAKVEITNCEIIYWTPWK